MIAVNALANALPLFGRSTGEVSDTYPTLFTPAGYTFSVWGVIYLLLAGFVIYQALPRSASNPRLVAARPLFVLSSVLNALWLVSWHALAITVSELLMVSAAALLGLLAAVTRRDWGYALVIAWGLGGIAAARGGGPVTTAALVAVGALAVAAVVAIVTGGRYTSPAMRNIDPNPAPPRY